MSSIGIGASAIFTDRGWKRWKKQVKLSLGNSHDSAPVLIKHAKSGWESKAAWNWDEAIRQYRALHEDLGRHLQHPADQQQANYERIHSYLSLDTWAFVPILLWQQSVADDQLKECIGGWKKLRYRWPIASITHWSIRQCQALALLEWSRCAGEKEAEVEAVGLFVNPRTPQDSQEYFLDTLSTLSFDLFRHHYSAWRYVKAKQWLKISLDSLNSLKPLSQSPSRFQLVWWQKKLLLEAGERDKSERVANT